MVILYLYILLVINPFVDYSHEKIQISDDDLPNTDHISALWDIMPTFSEIAGVKPPEDIDSISFLPDLQGNARTHG